MNKNEPRYSIEVLVDALYRGILSRAPDEKGFLNKIRRLGSLDADAMDLATFIKDFLLSHEYQEKASRRFVQQLIASSSLKNMEATDFVSIGSHCLVSYTLKAMGIKRYSCPFDWIFSRPSMVEHCIKDSFATLTDRSQYHSVIEGGTELRGLCHHVFYKDSFGINRLFNHQDMRIEENYQYLLRCIDRFTKLLASDKRKVFVLLSRHVGVTDEFLSLHNTLSRSTSNFSLFFVVVGKPQEKVHDFGIDSIKTVGQSCLAAMRPVSRAGPLTFEDPFDDFMFRRAIATFAGTEKNTVFTELDA